jgi:folate-binding protein YgfZ
MFVLRAKVQLIDATEQYPIWGFVGNVVNEFFPTQNNQTTVPWTSSVNEQNSMISLYPSQQLARAILLGPLTDSIKNTTNVITKNEWDLCTILSGVTLIGQDLADAFVPQMINYESVGGVNFKKGCYPGQEVVARSQFRGTLKRRLYLCTSTTIASVGQELRLTSDPEQSCGTVVEAVSALGQQCVFLASMQIAAAEKATSFDAAQDSSELQLIDNSNKVEHTDQHNSLAVKILPLPYELLTDI